ncbi:MAG: pyridoxine 5'-phosphate synthase [Acidobacteria bacterium]|nr:pyridoxine 5'-phosphate synthase [Acidobacteriota bacterium]
MIKLGVNVDHVATLRQARQAHEPDPVAAALLAELAGADGITVHLRGDRRHIQERDLRLLRELVATRLNLEMAPTSEMLRIAVKIRPDTSTLVPERSEEVTTEGGLNLLKSAGEVKYAIEKLHKAGISVSLFVDPESKQIKQAASLGAQLVELNTSAYAEVVPLGLNEDHADFKRELAKIREAAALAHALGLRVLAGHGLTYRNVGPICKVPYITELNIGHNICARSVLVGMERAVREMLDAMHSTTP